MYWSGLVYWLKNTLLNEKNISPEDIELLEIVDSAEEVMDCLDRFYSNNNFKPNF